MTYNDINSLIQRGYTTSKTERGYSRSLQRAFKGGRYCVAKKEDGYIIIFYRNTPIFYINKNDFVIMRTGRFKTKIMKERLNFLIKGKGFIDDDWLYVESTGIKIPFFNGIEIDNKGLVYQIETVRNHLKGICPTENPATKGVHYELPS